MYNVGEKKATREAYGAALKEFGKDENIIVLDADLSKSTKTDVFKKTYPERFVFSCFVSRDLIADSPHSFDQIAS